MTYDNIKVNAGELKWALRKWLGSETPVTFRNYYSFDNLINEAVSAILQKRDQDERTKKAELPNDLFTAAELIRALELIGYGQHGRANVESWMRTIKNSVREPNWEVGDVAKDQYGILWRKATRGWNRFGSSNNYGDHELARPLKKVEV